eukprot:Gb_10075 [translate_table: standard]
MMCLPLSAFSHCVKNRSAELLYGYTASEAVGQNVVQLLMDNSNIDVANQLVNQLVEGQSLTGQFPLRKKSGDVFVAAVTNTPLYDEAGTFVGIICVSSDARPFCGEAAPLIDNKSFLCREAGDQRSRISDISKSKIESQHAFQIPLASKISTLASKVSSKVRSRMNNGNISVDHEGGSGGSHCSEHGLPDIGLLSDQREYSEVHSREASVPRGGATSPHSGVLMPSTPFGKLRGKAENDAGDEGKGKDGVRHTLGSKAEAWMAKKGITWHWGGGERDSGDTKSRFLWPWLNPDREKDSRNNRRTDTNGHRESYAADVNHSKFSDAPGSWPSNTISSTSNNSSSSSASTTTVPKVEADLGNVDCEILWEELTIGEQIGQGSSQHPFSFFQFLSFIMY